jgi:exodeoxyribonuclease VII large subunit
MESPSDAVFTVTQLTEEISNLLSSEYRSIAVEGEISGLKIASSGHAYFSLKDETSLLKAVMWRSRIARQTEMPADGQLVRAFGGITIYPPRGEYQLDVQKITQAGIGLLQQRFEELKRKLETEGLFDPDRKREPPFRIKKVAVITSPTGAALRDFLRTLEHDGAPLEILILPTRVQGLEAAGEIVQALQKIPRLGCDLVVVTRGGGSLEDLWSFNEEAVARAIAACPVPVVSAVGHEVDFTIADFVADIRVATPTAAAQFLVDRVTGLHDLLEELRERLGEGMSDKLRDLKGELESCKHRLLASSPLAALPYHRQRVDDTTERMIRALKRRAEIARSKVEDRKQRIASLFQLNRVKWRGRVEALEEHLAALDPDATLKRGYALCETADGERRIRATADVPKKGNVRVHLSDGDFEATPVDL